MDELADRTIAKCNEKGIPVKRVTDEVIVEMDVEEARSEEYDTCVLCSNASGAVEIYWGRSKPKSEKLQKKAAVKKAPAKKLAAKKPAAKAPAKAKK